MNLAKTFLTSETRSDVKHESSHLTLIIAVGQT